MVTDESGNSIPNATIKIKNSRSGTSASADGAFRINAATNAVLIISVVGYESKEVAIGNSSSIAVKLAIDTKAIGEVVVTGTGSAVSKKKLAFAVETVNIANQTKVPTGDVGQQLVGQIAGAQISSTGGLPGKDINILLRGVNTITRGTSPMILLDGIQLGATNLNSLDLSNIEKVEVIQGAASATLIWRTGG